MSSGAGRRLARSATTSRPSRSPATDSGSTISEPTPVRRRTSWPDEAAAGGVADGVGGGAVVDPGGHRGELLGRELAEGDAERALGEVRIERAVAVGQRDEARLAARQLERGGERLAHDALGVLGRGQPGGGAGQALGGRGRADGADLLQARRQQRGAALDLRHRGGVDRGQRLRVEHADDLAGDDAAGSRPRSARRGSRAGSPAPRRCRRRRRRRRCGRRGRRSRCVTAGRRRPARSRARPGSAGARPGRGRRWAAGRGGRGARRPPRWLRARCRRARGRARAGR